MSIVSPASASSPRFRVGSSSAQSTRGTYWNLQSAKASPGNRSGSCIKRRAAIDFRSSLRHACVDPPCSQFAWVPPSHLHVTHCKHKGHSSLPTLKIINCSSPHCSLSFRPVSQLTICSLCYYRPTFALQSVVSVHTTKSDNPASRRSSTRLPQPRLVNGALSALRPRVVQPRSTIVPPPIHLAIILFRSSDALCCFYPATFHSNLVDTDQRFNCIECKTLSTV